MAPFTAASASRNRARQIAELKKNKAIWDALQTPSIENLQMVVQQEISQGRLTPELGTSILADPSAMAEVGANPELVRAQEASLGALQNIARQGGMDTQSRANLAQIQDQLGQQERGQREALLAQQQRQGTVGSGQGLAAQLLAQQASAGRAGQAGFQQAKSADQRALEALTQSGQMAGQMRTQQVGEAERRAAAEDRINKFNTQHRQQLQAANRQALNAANRYNLDLNVGRENRNVGRRQDASRQHANAYINKFNLDRSKVAGQTGVNTAVANARGDKARTMEQATGLLLKDAGESADKAAKGAGFAFADGAVVPGQNYAGDRVDAQLNSGEMVLNAEQQQQLLDLLSGKTKYIDTETPIVQENPMPEDPLAVLANMNQPQQMADGGIVDMFKKSPLYKIFQAGKKFGKDTLRKNPEVKDIIRSEVPIKKDVEMALGHVSPPTPTPVGSSTPVDSPINTAPPVGNVATGVGDAPPPNMMINDDTNPPVDTPVDTPMTPVQQPATQPEEEEDKQDIIEVLFGLDPGRTTGQKVAGGIGGALKALGTVADPGSATETTSPFEQQRQLTDYKAAIEEGKYQRRRGDKLSDQEKKAEEEAEKQRKLEEPPKTYKDVIDRYANTSYGKDRLQKIQNMITGYIKLEKLMEGGDIINEAWANKAKAALTSLMEPWLRINTGAQINDKEYSRLMGMAPSTLNNALHGKDTGTFKMGIIRDFMESNVLTYTHGTTTLNSFAYLYKNVPGSRFPQQASNSAIQLTPPQAYGTQSKEQPKEDYSGIKDIDAEIAAEEAKMAKKNKKK